MKYESLSRLSFATAVIICAAGAALLAGCGHQESAAQSPQQIKSAMGGRYTPSEMAQAQAFRQQEAQTQARMTQRMQGRTSGNAPTPANGAKP